ncbi:von Willebrand factor A domain-containing protein 7-like [Ylistrum balloti]|uniref:von Willebrand factor A domain-containing protein 7-like n=1 Tax=Ylistrum balloti TaxID=509963 RepID=UPI002905AEE9|nr:von Willebrand factor A domain-containing protein 7-like [Ylistrum balloti]
MEISTILSSETLTDTAMTTLVDRVGKCLMIIQSFYSNTNWVEMNGAVPYTNFGSPAALTLMPIASSHKETCKSCDNSYAALRMGSCNDNLLVDDHLTSGYRSGQLISTKPSADNSDTTGKCSHGGVTDAGADIPPTGGINKETTEWALSPHAHLHYDASEAAIQATAHFFLNSATGILTDVTQENIMKLLGLQLKSATSLGFVVDVSGSMGDDIASVRLALSQKVNEARRSDAAPGIYVLATFSDPEYLTTARNTTDANEMIEWIDGLSASGGGDCPEYAMSGLLAGVELSEPNSEIFLATDASAKDSSDANTAISAIIAKGIKVHFLLTGSCSSSRRHILSRKKRDLATFQNIAASSGGSVYQIGSLELSTVLGHLLEENFASSIAVMDYFIQTTGESNSMTITVDSGSISLFISITGPHSLTEASLLDPLGRVETFSTENATRHYSSYKIKMTIQNPTPGTWMLTRFSSREWELNITVSSELDIDVQLIETDDSGIHYVSTRNPISGTNYTLAVVVYNLNTSSTSFSVNILDADGTVTSNTPINITFGESKTTGYIPIVIPAANFYVQLIGTDQNGFQFKRMAGAMFTPVGVDLFVQPIFGNLDIGTLQNITYTLSNQGSTTETYTVSIVDDKGRALPPTSKHHSVNAGSNVTDNFQLSSTTELEYTTYTISVTSFGSSTVLQSTTYTVMFTGAFCSSFMTTPKCEVENTGNCSLFSWSASAVFSFDVLTFLVTDNVTVVIDGGDTTRLYISGSCCVTNFTLNAFPTAGSGCQATQYVYKSLSGFQYVTSLEITDDTSGKDGDDVTYVTEDTETNLGLIAGVLIGVAVLILGVTAVLKYVTSKKVVKENTSMVEFEETKHPDTSQKTRFDPKTLSPKAWDCEVTFAPRPPMTTRMKF